MAHQTIADQPNDHAQVDAQARVTQLQNFTNLCCPIREIHQRIYFCLSDLFDLPTYTATKPIKTKLKMTTAYFLKLYKNAASAFSIMQHLKISFFPFNNATNNIQQHTTHGIVAAKKSFSKFKKPF